jgi:integrase
MKIKDFFEDQYRIIRLRGRSQNTVRLYRTSIKLLDNLLGRSAVLSDFSDLTIARLMQNVLDKGGSPFSANKHRSQLLAIWRYGCMIKLVHHWPTVMAETTPERIPVAWIASDLHQLMRTIDNLPGFVGETPAKLWWKALLLMLIDTGERISAISQVGWADIEAVWLTVPAEYRKGKRRDRRYLLTDDTLAALSQLGKFRESKSIFPWPYNRTYLWTKYTKILEKAGLPAGRKDKFHRLRKTVGSVAHANGLDATSVLDHSSARVTKAYLDPRFRPQIEHATVIQAWLKGDS